MRNKLQNFNAMPKATLKMRRDGTGGAHQVSKKAILLQCLLFIVVMSLLVSKYWQPFILPAVDAVQRMNPLSTTADDVRAMVLFVSTAVSAIAAVTVVWFCSGWVVAPVRRTKA